MALDSAPRCCRPSDLGHHGIFITARSPFLPNLRNLRDSTSDSLPSRCGQPAWGSSFLFKRPAGLPSSPDPLACPSFLSPSLRGNLIFPRQFSSLIWAHYFYISIIDIIPGFHAFPAPPNTATGKQPSWCEIQKMNHLRRERNATIIEIHTIGERAITNPIFLLCADYS